MRAKPIALVLAAVLAWGGVTLPQVEDRGGTTQSPPSPWKVELLKQLKWLQEAAEEAAYFCALAASAPAVQDQKVLALRVVNILEGSSGPHFTPQLAGAEKLPGMLPQLAKLEKQIKQAPIPEAEKKSIYFELTNIEFFLTWALQAALRGAVGRRVLLGAVSLRQAYAALLAALGPEDPKLAYLGGIKPLLKKYGPEPAAGH